LNSQSTAPGQTVAIATACPLHFGPGAGYEFMKSIDSPTASWESNLFKRRIERVANRAARAKIGHSARVDRSGGLSRARMA
jgi:hypothetical protein